ncbi:MAG: hypothetical protein UT61_C0067G0009 [Candidatus Woesebacteria bacterium GW2011_GWA1_39_8]|uniref:Uncharacterized protein n=1 Tax=Candidatus Woesebacteria bacterium GW2011_GWA1_39_8 TaxID=1618552 RepID=A0A0G0PIN1_9BACT|nr:MAG: hypothetical protein UT61_C0067G0009 [Candidatus Woesebacteria bacterium GW2011_GWA1_39_8]
MTNINFDPAQRGTQEPVETYEDEAGLVFNKVERKPGEEPRSTGSLTEGGVTFDLVKPRSAVGDSF